MAHLSFGFPAHLLRDQLPILDQWLSDLISLWNHAGEVRLDAWKKEQRRMSFIDTGRMLLDWPAWEKENHSNGLSEMLAHMGRDQMARLDLAYKVFFLRWRVENRGKKAWYPQFHPETNNFSFVPPILGALGTPVRWDPLGQDIPARIYQGRVSPKHAYGGTQIHHSSVPARQTRGESLPTLERVSRRAHPRQRVDSQNRKSATGLYAIGLTTNGDGPKR